MIRYLCVFTPNNFTTLGDHTKFADIDLENQISNKSRTFFFSFSYFKNSSFGNHAERCVERWTWILFNTDDRQLKGCFQFRMCYMGFSETKSLKNRIFSIKKMQKDKRLFTIGRINRSNFGGLRVKPSPTKHGFVTKRFQAFSDKIKRETTVKIFDFIFEILTLSFARLNNSEDFSFTNSFHFRNRHIPFALRERHNNCCWIFRFDSIFLRLFLFVFV